MEYCCIHCEFWKLWNGVKVVLEMSKVKTAYIHLSFVFCFCHEFCAMSCNVLRLLSILSSWVCYTEETGCRNHPNLLLLLSTVGVNYNPWPAQWDVTLCGWVTHTELSFWCGWIMLRASGNSYLTELGWVRVATLTLMLFSNLERSVQYSPLMAFFWTMLIALVLPFSGYCKAILFS